MMLQPPTASLRSVVLRLERIGDDRAHTHRRSPTLRSYMDTLRRGSPWVADITDGRVLLKPLRDYASANGRGSRGIFDTYILREGRVYEVNAVTSWTSHRRYRCRVEAGTIVELP